MGTHLLKGISAALMVTILTLFIGIVWSTVGLGGLSTSRLLDIGLFASCLIGGYRTAKESGMWWMGGVTGAGFVSVGTLLLALFLPIRGWGFVQVLGEGVLIGLVAGIAGAKGLQGAASGMWQGRRSPAYFRPSYEGYNSDDHRSDEFEWNTEDNTQDRAGTSSSFWGEKTEKESHWNLESKWDSEKDSAVEWPWEQKEEKLLPSAVGSAEPVMAFEPEQVQSEAVKGNVLRNKIFDRSKSSVKNMSGDQEKNALPWWEQ